MRNLFIHFLTVYICSCSITSQSAVQDEVQTFLDQYTKTYLELSYESSKAEWKTNTYIIEGSTETAEATQQAKEALSEFTGSVENIEKIRKFLQTKDQLTPLQVRQLQKALYMAADKPQTVPDLVKERIRLETKLIEQLFGFDFKIEDKSVSTNDIDKVLWTETDVEKRLQAWIASKEVGKDLKQGLADVRDLRNKTVQALGYDNFFAYQVSDYGLSTPQMLSSLKKIYQDIFPLYRELHTYTRYELAKRYKMDVPDELPAHWLPNRWGQDWYEMIQVEGMDLNSVLEKKEPEFLLQQSEQFYISIGFEPLPKSFYELSSLYPLIKDAKYKKNNHASAWHMDLNHDVRCLMSIEPNASWYETTHHELGHIYYYLSYTNPNVPPLLREGGNRAFHEAVGSLMGLASMQKPFIQAVNLLPQDSETDHVQILLKEALNYVVFIPFSTGLMTLFEHDLYAENLPIDEFNKRWWDIARAYQGIVPPTVRGEEYCDAASKTHIIDDSGQYYDYALSFVLLFQLHEHIANNILHQDMHATNYYGNKEVGDFLKKLLEPGASRDWRDLLQESIGTNEMSSQAMLNYFEPLMNYLKEQNKDRTHTLKMVE